MKKKTRCLSSPLSVIAPGFGLSLKDLLSCESYLRKEHSYTGESLSSLLGKDLLFSHSKEKRFRSLKKALKKGGLIWCLRGGYGSVHLLPFLARLKKPSKPCVLLGYSDVTALHAFFHKVWRLPTLHGPFLDGLLKKDVSSKDFQDLKKILKGEKKELSYTLKPMNLLAKKGGALKGVIRGGNLCVLQTLIGTDFCPSFSGCFLFLEDIGERAYRVHRMLTHFEQAGLFKGVRAVLLGNFIHDNFHKKEKVLLKKVLKNWAEKEMKVPVFYGLPSGHGKNQAVLPMNTQSMIHNKKLTVSLKEIPL